MIRALAFLLPAFLVFWSAAGWAQEPPVVLKEGSILVCPATGLEQTAHTFEPSDCAQLDSHWQIDPQHRTLWIRGQFDIPQAVLDSREPTGFYLSIKAASRVWLNGELLGENGVPGLTAETELPGRLDRVFFVTPDMMQAGENELVMLVSGHHSLLTLYAPLHTASLGPYGVPRWQILDHYWPSLLTFGLFFVGFLYFGTFAILRVDRWGSGFLALASGAAGAQLLSEIMRGLWSYPYPFHDVRLVLILFFAALFGLSILAHTAHRFGRSRPKWIVGGASLLTLALIVFMRGFDGKTTFAILIPTVAASLISGVAARRGQREGLSYAGIYLGFLILMLFGPFSFLDTSFYFLVAGLLTFLFVQQARAYRQMALDHADTERRRRQLETALEKATKAQSATLTLKSSGKFQRLNANEIASASGAGDYVELALANGGELLHSGSLTALESELPPHFLRVHRSHIVNTSLIDELRRLPSGTGELVLSTGHLVPVSKRIMPRVREALDGV